MDRNSKVVFDEMVLLMEEMKADNGQWDSKSNKAAAGRVRKASLVLAKLGKEYRELSVAEAKVEKN